MVNKCERLINVVKTEGPWTQVRDPAKRQSSGHKDSQLSCHGRHTTGGKSEPNLLSLFKRNPVNPSCPSLEESVPQGTPMAWWVEERGKSESHPVMG